MKYLDKIEYVRKATYPGHYEAGIQYRNKVLRGVITDMTLIDAWKDDRTYRGSRRAATLARRIYQIVRDQNRQKVSQGERVRNAIVEKMGIDKEWARDHFEVIMC